MELSNRSFCYTSSVQLAEMGMEEALWSLDQALNTSGYTWSGWTLTTDGSGVKWATKQLTGFIVTKGVPGVVNIQIQYYDHYSAPAVYGAQPPTITSDGVVQMTDGVTIDKQLKATAKPAALFSNAVGAYSSCSFTINWICPLASYETHVSLNPTSASQTRKDEAIVSAPSVSVNAADVFGYVATAGTAPTYSTGGTVKRADSSVPRDSRYISTNASQYLFDILSSANLPGPWAGTVSDRTAPIGTHVFGTQADLKRYTANDFSLTSFHTLTIDGPVIIDVSGNLYIDDSASIFITANGSAQIVVGGSVTILGNVNNTTTKLPKNLAIICRSSGSYSSINYYTAQLNTSDPFYGVIYVPYGSLQVYGTITVYGALVANVMDQAYGNGVIYYDLDLRKTAFSTLNTPYDISQWLAN